MTHGAAPGPSPAWLKEVEHFHTCAIESKKNYKGIYTPDSVRNNDIEITGRVDPKKSEKDRQNDLKLHQERKAIKEILSRKPSKRDLLKSQSEQVFKEVLQKQAEEKARYAHSRKGLQGKMMSAKDKKEYAEMRALLVGAKTKNEKNRINPLKNRIPQEASITSDDHSSKESYCRYFDESSLPSIKEGDEVESEESIEKESYKKNSNSSSSSAAPIIREDESISVGSYKGTILTPRQKFLSLSKNEKKLQEDPISARTKLFQILESINGTSKHALLHPFPEVWDPEVGALSKNPSEIIQNHVSVTDLAEFQSMKIPGEITALIMACVAILFNKPTDWKTVQNSLLAPNLYAFRHTLITFDRNVVSNAQRKVFIKKMSILKRKIGDVNKRCKAGKGLYEWLICHYIYFTMRGEKTQQEIIILEDEQAWKEGNTGAFKSLVAEATKVQVSSGGGLKSKPKDKSTKGKQTWVQKRALREQETQQYIAELEKTVEKATSAKKDATSASLQKRAKKQIKSKEKNNKVYSNKPLIAHKEGKKTTKDTTSQKGKMYTNIKESNKDSNFGSKPTNEIKSGKTDTVQVTEVVTKNKNLKDSSVHINEKEASMKSGKISTTSTKSTEPNQSLPKRKSSLEKLSELFTRRPSFTVDKTANKEKKLDPSKDNKVEKESKEEDKKSIVPAPSQEMKNKQEIQPNANEDQSKALKQKTPSTGPSSEPVHEKSKIIDTTNAKDIRPLEGDDSPSKTKAEEAPSSTSKVEENVLTKTKDQGNEEVYTPINSFEEDVNISKELDPPVMLKDTISNESFNSFNKSGKLYERISKEESVGEEEDEYTPINSPTSQKMKEKKTEIVEEEIIKSLSPVAKNTPALSNKKETFTSNPSSSSIDYALSPKSNYDADFEIASLKDEEYTFEEESVNDNGKSKSDNLSDKGQDSFLDEEVESLPKEEKAEKDFYKEVMNSIVTEGTSETVDYDNDSFDAGSEEDKQKKKNSIIEESTSKLDSIKSVSGAGEGEEDPDDIYSVDFN